VALAERDVDELGPAPADVVVESPSSVGPDAGRRTGPHGATAAPRPGQRPQRAGARSGAKKRR
jgi:preprotein translocase subunit SecF